MKPVFIILYSVVITLVLTLAFPRLNQAGPKQRRFFWLMSVAGALVLVILIFFLFL